MQIAICVNTSKHTAVSVPMLDKDGHSLDQIGVDIEDEGAFEQLSPDDICKIYLVPAIQNLQARLKSKAA